MPIGAEPVIIIDDRGLSRITVNVRRGVIPLIARNRYEIMREPYIEQFRSGLDKKGYRAQLFVSITEIREAANECNKYKE